MCRLGIRRGVDQHVRETGRKRRGCGQTLGAPHTAWTQRRAHLEGDEDKRCRTARVSAITYPVCRRGCQETETGRSLQQTASRKERLAKRLGTQTEKHQGRGAVGSSPHPLTHRPRPSCWLFGAWMRPRGSKRRGRGEVSCTGLWPPGPRVPQLGPGLCRQGHWPPGAGVWFCE